MTSTSIGRLRANSVKRPVECQLGGPTVPVASEGIPQHYSLS